MTVWACVWVRHWLVLTAVGAVTAHQEVEAGVDVDAVLRDTLFAVSHARWGSVVNLIDAGQRNVLTAACDVPDEVEGSLWLEAAIHQDVRVQTEHLQEDEVTVCLEEVALDLHHVPQAQATGGLVDHMERHLREGERMWGTEKTRRRIRKDKERKVRKRKEEIGLETQGNKELHATHWPCD